jgi:hypothetical protein
LAGFSTNHSPRNKKLRRNRGYPGQGRGYMGFISFFIVYPFMVLCNGSKHLAKFSVDS